VVVLRRRQIHCVRTLLNIYASLVQVQPHVF